MMAWVFAATPFRLSAVLGLAKGGWAFEPPGGAFVPVILQVGLVGKRSLSKISKTDQGMQLVHISAASHVFLGVNALFSGNVKNMQVFSTA